MASVKKTSPAKKAEKELVSSSDLVRDLMPLPGSAIINRILELESPVKFVRAISCVDLYWLMKKIGEEDAQPLLKLASNEQWQFMVDLELWDRDRLDVEQTTLWLGRLFQADPERMARWLFGEGELLTYFYLSQMVEVHAKNKDEVFEDATFLTFDDVYYFRVRSGEHEDFVQQLLHHLAEMDYLRYQSMMMGLAGTLRDEVEEEIYRQRNVRIAEDGFLPYDEAVALYAHIDPDALKTEKSLPSPPGPEADLPPAPLAPILQVREKSLMLEVVRGDPLLLDRVRVEFAGLCNQVISADRVRVSDAEDLVKVCRKVAGYINVGLERLSGKDLDLAEDYVRKNPLPQIFRAGFSFALDVKWEVERWLKKAWFIRQGLRPGFWDDWGGTLVGILQKRPLLYRGALSQPPYADFESTAEVEKCRETLRQMMALDRLLEYLSSHYPVDKQWSKDPLFTFHSLLFNFWARQRLRIVPGFAPLSLEEVRNFFRSVRSGADKPPFSMQGFKEVFVEDMMAHLTDLDPETMKTLQETLSLAWEKFAEEYAWVATADMDGKYLKFILTSSSSGSAQR
jgi:hypothetical protein